MFRSVLCSRRDLGRSPSARLHRDAPARGRVGAIRRSLLAGAARRFSEPQRRSNALADRECAIAHQSIRSASARLAGMGRGAVPGTRFAAGPLESRL